MPAHRFKSSDLSMYAVKDKTWWASIGTVTHAQPKSNEKWIPLLYCISSFEHKSYKNL